MAKEDNSKIILKPKFYVCNCCGKKVEDVEEFPKNPTQMYGGYGGKLPLCWDCLEKEFEDYIAFYLTMYPSQEELSRKKAIRRICQKYDYYYSDNFYDAVVDGKSKGSTFLRGYITRCNLWQFRNRNYKTTMLEDFENGDIGENEVTKNNNMISEDVIEFFGRGLQEEDYFFLNNQYRDWVTRHECKNKAQEEIFKRISFKQWEIWKATIVGEDTKSLDDTFQKLLETANLQPKQNTKETLSETQTFGTLLDKWENTRPLPEIDEELKDVDRIGLYIDVFFKGHTAKMLNVKNAFSNLYTKFMDKLTVRKPEYSEEDDTEILFDNIFGDADLEQNN